MYPSRTKKHAQNKSDKTVFVQTARHAPFGKNSFVTHVFYAYLDHNLSDIHIGNIRLIISDKLYFKSDKNTRAKKSDIFDLYIGQILYKTNQNTRAK